MKRVFVLLVFLSAPALAGEKMFWQKSSLQDDLANIQKVEKELPEKAAKLSQDGEKSYSDFDKVFFQSQVLAYSEILASLKNDLASSEDFLKKGNLSEEERNKLLEKKESICEKSKSLEALRVRFYEKFHPLHLHPRNESKNWAMKSAQKLKARWNYDIFGFLGIKVSDEKSEASFSKAIVSSASACEFLAQALKPQPKKVDVPDVASEPAPAQWSGFPVN